MGSLFRQMLQLISLMLVLGFKSTKAEIYNTEEAGAAGLFVFGDSLVDVGNNNYLTLSIAKGNFPHYGVDLPDHQPTGRFSNGKNFADFLAEKLGLPSPPPYLSMRSSGHPIIDSVKSATVTGSRSQGDAAIDGKFFKGVSFASAAAGILNTTNPLIDIPTTSSTYELTSASISMDKQIEYYKEVYGMLVQKQGKARTELFLSECIFSIAIGNNDIGGQFHKIFPNPRGEMSKQQLINLLANTIKGQLKRIYDNGARKFAVEGVSLIGCIPSFRMRTKSGDCHEEVNFWALKYNEKLQAVLRELKTELQDFQYSYFDGWHFFFNLLRQPSPYGFKEVKVPCCRVGPPGSVTVPPAGCFPFSYLCPNRSDHLFWDVFHPTEAALRIILDAVVDGPQQYAFPENVRQLAFT